MKAVFQEINITILTGKGESWQNIRMQTVFSNGKSGYPWKSTLNLCLHIPLLFEGYPHIQPL